VDELVVDVLAAECEAVTTLLLDLDEHDFHRPTRCPPWDVRHLTAHLYRDFERIPIALAHPARQQPDTDRVGYWRSYDPATNQQRTQARAAAIAARYATGRRLARSFHTLWRDALGQATRVDHDQVVVTWGPVMRLEDFLATRIVEIAVHGLDLTDALARSPVLTPAAGQAVVEVLYALLGAGLPGELGWNQVVFIDKATGRAELTDAERDRLGNLATRFPLIV
jgi:uncharacterized protein (TIGR03083 family)